MFFTINYYIGVILKSLLCYFKHTQYNWHSRKICIFEKKLGTHHHQGETSNVTYSSKNEIQKTK